MNDMKRINLGSGDIAISFSAKLQGVIPFDFEDMHLQDERHRGFKIGLVVGEGDRRAYASEYIEYPDLQIEMEGKNASVPLGVLKQFALRLATNIMGTLINEKSKELK